MSEQTDTASRIVALTTYIDRDSGKLIAGTGECEPQAIISQAVSILEGRDRQRDEENRKAWEWKTFGPIAKEEYFKEANLSDKEKEKNWKLEIDGKEHILHEIYFKRIRKALREQGK